MACDQWRAQLDAYLDGELPTEPMRALDAHLRTCPGCAGDALARVQLKRAIKASGARFTPSPEFRNQIQKKIAGKPRRTWNVGWVLATAGFAVVLVAGLLSTYLERQNLRQQQLYSELADLHVSTLASANPVDVVSTDRHTVKPWFQGKVPFTFNLPELQNTDFMLLGGRVTYLGQVPGAHLIYQIRKHQISVFLFPENAVGLRNTSNISKERTFNVDTWTQDGLRYVVFGDVAPEDIRHLSSLLKGTARS
jgi:anti-sigma factor RsiW